MPVMDGIEATRRIRKLEANTPTLKIIALTAAMIENDAVKEGYLNVGFDDVAVKPISHSKFCKYIKRYLPEP